MSTECLAVERLETPRGLFLPQPSQKANFASVYGKTALYEAALKVYTKPLFYPEKGQVSSHDGRTLYHFAVRGLQNLERLHTLLSEHKFHFREGVEIHFKRNNKRRSVYIFPWEERITDELLYRTLNKFFDVLFSEQTYAFRYHGFGVDACQHRIARCLEKSPRPLYIIKRDVSNYYPSIDREILLALLDQWIEKDDYLYELLRERVNFRVRTDNGQTAPGRGIPFGAALACLLANIYLTPLDLEMSKVAGLTYFRYADDVLAFSPSREVALEGAERLTKMLAKLKLRSKTSHEMDIVFAGRSMPDDRFRSAPKFQHLGLEFRVDGSVGLPRVKGRKIRNLFRRAFQDAQSDLEALQAPEERATLLISKARQILNRGCRSIAILDYYLKHVNDEEQLKILDRWLAEEVLARVFRSGHCKGNFRRLSFEVLRKLGLPSLRHRRRLLCHGKLESSFFVLWTSCLIEKSSGGEFRNLSTEGRVGGEGAVARSRDLISISRSSGR